MRATRTAALLLALLAAAAGQAQAQRERPPRGLREVRSSGPNPREGFWLAIGLGAGAESFRADDGLGWSDDKGGAVGYLKLGGTVSPSLLLGAEAQVWSARYYGRTYLEDYDRTLGSLLAIAQVYPSSRGAVWLKGGVGFARDELDLFGPPTRPTVTGRNGVAFDLGLGYDVRVGRQVSVTPSLDLVWQRYESHDERLVNLAIVVTFH